MSYFHELLCACGSTFIHILAYGALLLLLWLTGYIPVLPRWPWGGYHPMKFCILTAFLNYNYCQLGAWGYTSSSCNTKCNTAIILSCTKHFSCKMKIRFSNLAYCKKATGKYNGSKVQQQCGHCKKPSITVLELHWIALKLRYPVAAS